MGQHTLGDVKGWSFCDLLLSYWVVAIVKGLSLLGGVRGKGRTGSAGELYASLVWAFWAHSPSLGRPRFHCCFLSLSPLPGLALTASNHGKRDLAALAWHRDPPAGWS